MFTCERDEECRLGDVVGLCEHDGFCTFEDSSCESGFRYDDEASDDVASTCAVACPASYTITLPSSRTRYRLINTTAQFWGQHSACNADLPGATHLANLETRQELDELVTAASAGGNEIYLAGVQDPLAVTPDVGWIDFRGKPTPLDQWSIGQPNDNNDIEPDHEQNILLLHRSDNGLQDRDGSEQNRAVCECDRHPVSELAQSFIDSDPNNPM